MRRDDDKYLMSRVVPPLVGLVLLSGFALAQSSSTSAIPDAQIEANVLKVLAGAPQLASENIISNTVYGTVTLSGTVKDEPIRQMAETLASKAGGVKKVIDELTLDASTGSPTSAPLGSYTNGTPEEQGTDSKGSNPRLQSDGTIAPEQQKTITPKQQETSAPAAQQAVQQPQHAPDPDTYAAQHSLDAQGAQSQAQDGSADHDQQTQPSYRQPYGAPTNDGSPQASSSPDMQHRHPQSDSRPSSQDSHQDQRGGPYPQPQSPSAYGAQRAGLPVLVPSGALMRIRINEGVDSKHTQPGTPFDAIVLNDVVADGAVAIPRGAAVQGIVVDATSGGTLKGHGGIALQLTQVTLAGKNYPITSDVWSRDSSDKGAQTIGTAVGLGAVGALIGAVAGGGSGALIGAGVGGAAGVGASAASGSRQILIPSEAILAFHLAQPAPLMTISQAEMDRLSYGVPAGAQPQMRRRSYPPPPPPPHYGPVYYPRPYPYPYPY